MRAGEGLVPGLGRIAASYYFYVAENDCGEAPRVLETTGRLDVTGKGELRFSLPRMADCVPSALMTTRPFTITGGSGIYAGASGSGMVDLRYQSTFTGAAGTDTWTGTLDVPGLEFDLTPPALTGTANKTVRARRGSKHMRVTFKVIASDEVDGPVAATCKPRSGSRFKIGRTTVKCSATDSSANTRVGTFRVTVKRRG